VGLFDKLFSKKPKMEDFAIMVQSALEKAGASGLKFNPADSSIRVESMDRTFYLDNAYRDYCHAETGNERTDRLGRYISSFLEAPTMPKDLASVKDHLMPSVRHPAYISLIPLKVMADGGDASQLSMPVKHIAPGLALGVAYDTEKSIMSVNSTSLENWGITLDAALELAMEHLRDRTPEDKFKQIVPGLYVSEFGDSYDSARVLLPDLLYRLQLNGDPVMFVPNRDQLWVTGKYDAPGIGAILKYGPESHFQQGHNLSPKLYQLAEGKVVEFFPEDPAQRQAAHSIECRRELTDYEQQGGYLKKINEREKRDIYISPYKLIQWKDGTLSSAAIWTKGADTLLPKTDEIAFVDTQTKESIRVPWQDASAIVNGLMEQEPNLDPVRFRVRRFPDDSQLNILRARVKPAVT
jgi:hypothetical protein